MAEDADCMAAPAPDHEHRKAVVVYPKQCKGGFEVGKKRFQARINGHYARATPARVMGSLA